MEITKEQLKAALATWEQLHRNGETLAYEESKAVPVEVYAEVSGEFLWSLLEEEAEVADITDALRGAGLL